MATGIGAKSFSLWCNMLIYNNLGGRSLNSEKSVFESLATSPRQWKFCTQNILKNILPNTAWVTLKRRKRRLDDKSGS